MKKNVENTEKDTFIEEPDSLENEDDIEKLNQSSILQAVVSATDWTTETILNQLNKGNIQLNPKFQRRDAWDKNRRSKFIESLFLGFPIPQLVLAESKERKGSYIVIDGKQRLLSIRQFAAKKGDPDFSQLKLSGLKIKTELNRKSLEDIQRDILLFESLSTFENQAIRTVVIKNWPNESFLYHVFLRLNTGSVTLSPQELRQALHPGEFIDFADTKSIESPALREILHLKKPDFRMRDVELLIRYYAFKNFLYKYNGQLKKFLDETCEVLNSEWEERKDELKSQSEEFEEAYKATVNIFGIDNCFKKWNADYFEPRFNRAIFDIMMIYFSDSRIRPEAIRNKDEIVLAFKNLCSNDTEFLESIERTTKSLSATHIRLSRWAQVLNDNLGVNIKVPSLQSNRIV